MKKLNFTAITFTVLLTFLALTLPSCTDAGTLIRVDNGNNGNIEVYRYFFDDGEYVYVARFKDSPNVVSTTWSEYNPALKMFITKGNVALFENDSTEN
ncbi:MAG: hypothetical protein RBT57_02900 [Paludibacter sp.]|jgi:hypothetical protein|nr:hypothetical protein [Paludibacter sp.]